MLLFLINKSLKPRKNNTLVLILHILTQKLHWKPAGINKDSNLIVEHGAHYTQRCILQWKFGDKLILTLYSFWSQNQIMIILHDFDDIQLNFKDLRDMIFRSHACLLHINDSFENMSFYILRFLIAANISVSLHVYHD